MGQVQPEQRQRGRRQAAHREPADDLPIDRTVAVVHAGACGLRDRGHEQVGADGGLRHDAEHHHEDGRHQRAAADAGDADDDADQQAGDAMGNIEKHGETSAVRNGTGWKGMPCRPMRRKAGRRHVTARRAPAGHRDAFSLLPVHFHSRKTDKHKQMRRPHVAMRRGRGSAVTSPQVTPGQAPGDGEVPRLPRSPPCACRPPTAKGKP